MRRNGAQSVAHRRKTGGRTKGTPNKRTHAHRERLSELGCDPLEFLCKVVAGDVPGIDGRDRVKAAMDLRRVQTPDVRERPLRINLPPIKSLADLPRVWTAIFGAARAGDLTPGEAKILAEILGEVRQGYEATETQHRLQAIEAKLGLATP